MSLYWINKRLDPDQKELVEIASSLTDTLNSSIHTFQKIYADLRPTFMTDLGLVDSIYCLLEHHKEQSRVNFKTSLPETLNLEPGLSNSIFHICRQLIKNIVEYSDAARAEIKLRKKRGMLEINIKDNGKGIEKINMVDSELFGLVKVNEVVNFWGGTAMICIQKNLGTEVSVYIPLKNGKI